MSRTLEDRASPARVPRDGTPEQKAHLPRNFGLGLLSGVVGEAARDFIHPQLILVGMVVVLVGDRPGLASVLAALVTIADKLGALGPQLVVGSRLEHLERKRPAFIALTSARAVVLAGLVGTLWLLADGVTTGRLALFYGVFFVSCMLGGSGHVAFMDMTARMIPPGRISRFFGLRNFFGGAVSVAVGFLVIQPILSAEEGAGAYLTLAVVGGTLMVAGTVLFWFVREGDGPRARERTTLGQSLRRGLRWLREDRSYRMYFWLRVAFRICFLTLAFFIPYGKAQLEVAGTGVSVAVLGGIMIGTLKLSRVVSAAVWGTVGDTYGYRVCLLGSGAAFTVSPLLALAAPHVPTAFAVPIPFTTVQLTLPIMVYLLALATFGVALQASVIGGQRFLLTCAPPHRRPSYVGFANTITSPLTLLPLLAAGVVHWLGMSALFALVALGGVLYVWGARHIAPDRSVTPEADEAGAVAVKAAD